MAFGQTQSNSSIVVTSALSSHFNTPGPSSKAHLLPSVARILLLVPETAVNALSLNAGNETNHVRARGVEML